MLDSQSRLIFKLKLRRKLTLSFQQTLGLTGLLLSHETKLRLARKSSKLGHLLLHEGDFTIDDYLGDCRAVVNTRYNNERAMLSNSYERDLWAAVEKFVAPGSVCLDIGASTGTVSLLLARKVGPTGKVFSFEPGPEFFERLKNNFKLNPKFSSVACLNQIGLSNKNGKLYWKHDKAFPGNAFIWGESGTEIPVTRLDEFFASPPSRLDFIKIDVEGMELEVIEGAVETIKKYRPVIFFETMMHFETLRKMPIRKSLEELFKSLGYSLYSINGSGEMTPVAYPNFKDNTVALPSVVARA